MSAIPFVTLDEPRYGVAVPVSPLVRRVIANNPSKYTYLGTGTYIVGTGDVAVIDPGPQLDDHRDALAAALDGDTCSGDPGHPLPFRSLAAGRVAARRDRRAHGRLRAAPATDFEIAARRPRCRDDAEPDDDAAKVEESTRHWTSSPTSASPTARSRRWAPGGRCAPCTHPGTPSNHMCYALDEERALFTGDHVMGWSTTVVSPPDGDMRAYIDSLRKVMDARRRIAVAHPRRAGDVTQPFLDAFLAHRLRARGAGARPQCGPASRRSPTWSRCCTPTCARSCTRPAGRSVLSHLIKLVDDGPVTVEGQAGRHERTCRRPEPGGVPVTQILVEDAALGEPIERLLHRRGQRAVDALDLGDLVGGGPLQLGQFAEVLDDGGGQSPA